MIQQIDPSIKILFTDEGFLYSNSLLIEDKKTVLVEGAAGSIFNSISTESVEDVFLTHHHLDHINGLDLFPGATVHIQQIEAEALHQPEKTTATELWDELMPDSPDRHAHLFAEMEEKAFRKWPRDDIFTGEPVYDLGTFSLQALVTPGHTAGHTSWFIPERGLLFSGDICLTKVGPWYGDKDTTIDEFIESVNRIIELKPERLVTGHNPAVISENITEELNHYVNRIHKREERIYKALKEEPLTIHELADKKLIYPIHPTPFVEYWEKAMLIKHLDRLEKERRICIMDENRYTTIP